ncbi:MFS transporter [Ramlibacter ginsenosidimutans]|uniref:MFS transporter n=1 Tax=Ramlibacter ginsenosidimutans TaxID=502333 RepID=A0A934TQ31_9BURK|nr:MFS transporter [Ramlibacter ginsenosidimutans]
MKTVAPSFAQVAGSRDSTPALFLAFACGLIAANLYYAQPLAGPLAASLGLPPGAAGLLVAMTQAGYGTGLLLAAPLGDVVENRRLVLALLAASFCGLCGLASASGPALFLACAFLTGVGSVAVQVLIPYSAHLAPEPQRGRVVGTVMAGMTLGIMLARPVSSALAGLGWDRAAFALSALAMAALALVLRRALPARQPAAAGRYSDLLVSMLRLVGREPVLRERALQHLFMFGSFSLFWTTVPLQLAQGYGLSRSGIAWFALAGVAGVVSAPVAGRLADQGKSGPATALAMASALVALLVAHLAPGGTTLGLGLLVFAAILLDFGIVANLSLGKQAIFALDPALRSRLNAVYTALFFTGGAAGSFIGSWAQANGGWTLASRIGMALPACALALLAWGNRPR